MFGVKFGNKSKKSKQPPTQNGYQPMVISEPCKPVEMADLEVVAVFDPPKNVAYQYLHFKKGERMILKDQTNNDWWKVERVNARDNLPNDGFVPASFFEKLNSMDAQPWFFPDLDRNGAIKLLTSMSKLGAGGFLVRKSSKGGYALDVKMSSKHEKVAHFLFNTEHDYSVESSFHFPTLPELIQHYSKYGNQVLKLTEPATRQVPLVPKHEDDKWEIEPSQIDKREVIGAGCYGKVYHGRWSGVLDVAIKELKMADCKDSKAFLKEFTALKDLNHDNLLRLYGVCTSGTQHMLITEYLVNGSLLSFMKRNSLNFSTNLDILMQITRGMDYLEKRGIIHRDLAARNVLVGDVVNGLPNVKVCDFGLARNISINGVYEAKTAIPKFWTAPESLLTGEFCPKCDQWSFGVLIFEVFTRGQERTSKAYGVDDKTSLQELYKVIVVQGRRLSINCPTALKEKVVNRCFALEPAKRPLFSELLCAMAELNVDGESDKQAHSGYQN